MLVLTRKTQQQIQIGNDITITILQVKGQAVRVGITAPRNVSVLRTELAEKLMAECSISDEPASASPSRRSVPQPGAANPGEKNTLTSANSLKRILRCRASSAASTPLTTHPQRSGSASLAPKEACSLS